MRHYFSSTETTITVTLWDGEYTSTDGSDVYVIWVCRHSVYGNQAESVNYGTGFSGGSYTFTGLQPGTAYSMSASVRYAQATFAELFSATAYTQDPPLPPRPGAFAWTTPKVTGQPFALTAAEWNGLTANINAVRQHRGLATVSFSTAGSRLPFRAAVYNEALSAVRDMGAGAALGYQYAGDPVTAAALNGLVAALNSVQ